MKYSDFPRGYVEGRAESLSVILAAVFFFCLIPLVYLLLLMADGRKLERRLLRHQPGRGKNAQKPSREHGYSGWIEESSRTAVSDTDTIPARPF